MIVSKLKVYNNSFSKIWKSIVLMSTFLVLSDAVTIMSVDLGSEWMKIAVVAPGIPMEIALNLESKRKTPVAISFRGGERALGDSALSAGMKSPTLSYAYLLDLLGKKVDNPLVKLYQQRFPYYNIEADPERGTVLFRYDENTTYSVEELFAQILNYARELAMSYTDQKIKDIVITVPPFFTQAERRSLLASAELAGLKVLSLMNTDAAVALNYGMFRRKEINETAQNILFYDMGASATTATIASYHTVKTKERGFTETNPQVSILGVGYDRTLGGLEMQLRLRDFLARKFNDMKKTPNNVFESPRGMAKLMKEAAKLKNVLSANTEFLSQVEGVLDDKDFRLTVKREEFEALVGDLFDRVRTPIDHALIAAAIDISEIHQFIIIGGNTRVPKIQWILQDLWGQELGKNINADEAAALGAVYRAADLGQGFKVMKFHVKEAVTYPMDVDFQRTLEVANDSGEQGTSAEVDSTKVSKKMVKRSLFARSNSYPQKKVMTFNKHTDDFGFEVNYGELSNHLSRDQVKWVGSQNISTVRVTGVTQAFEKNLANGSGAESKGIKAHFSMDDSGILTLTAVEAIFEKNVTVEVDPAEEESTLSKIGSTLSKLFSGSEDESENSNKTESAETETPDKKSEETKNNKEGEEKEKTKEENGGKDKKDKKKKKETKPKLVTLKENLNVTVEFIDVKEITVQSKEASMEKLKKINDQENLRKEKEKQKNVLETYILDVQHKLSQDEYEKASQQENRVTIKEMATKMEEWLYEEGFDEEPSVYESRTKSLQALFEPIRSRVKEAQERPEALKALHDMINVSSMFHYRAVNAGSHEKWFTDVEMKTLDGLIINTQKWLETKQEEQEKLEPYKDPVLTLASVAEKIGAMDREIKYLVNKGRIAKAKKEREEAEAKLKEAKEKAEKELKEMLKKANITDSLNVTQGNDSRQEPPLPTEEEEGKKETVSEAEENEGEKNRRKDEEEELAHEEM